ncbi:hypothetical protein F66182_1402 [Fusarium sp. NRRL 66182]|nr:hypothetical protein F66182_1402 [Fusarium sp. NRRL 66182]
MPCCVAIIQFQQCQHSNLFKVGCTNNCDGLCPSSDQQTLVITNYLWFCEECHLRDCIKAGDARSTKWAARSADIAKANPQKDYRIQAYMLEHLEFLDNALCERKNASKIEEIQWVAEWTYEYGLMLYDVLYKHAWDLQAAAARIARLRDLRLWDLVVVQDALRSSRDLLDSQSHESYWTIKDNFDEQRLGWTFFSPERPDRPPPPLFPDEEKLSSENQPGQELDKPVTDEDMGF